MEQKILRILRTKPFILFALLYFLQNAISSENIITFIHKKSPDTLSGFNINPAANFPINSSSL